MLAIALLTTTTLTWHRAHRSQSVAFEPVHSPGGEHRARAVTLAVIAVGTLVTGTGPHAGDSAEVPRMRFHWDDVTVVHGVLGPATLVLGVALLVLLARVPGPTRTAARDHLPGRGGAAGARRRRPGAHSRCRRRSSPFHLLGSAFVWVGALRVLLDVNPRLFTVRAQRRQPVEELAPAL